MSLEALDTITLAEEKARQTIRDFLGQCGKVAVFL